MQALSRWVTAACLSIAAATAVAEDSMIELATHSGCFICHSIESKADAGTPLAPPYTAIADRYRERKDAFSYLTPRVLHGTAYTEQNWEGRVSMRFMPPNVNISREDAAALVNWILGLKTEVTVSDRFRRHEAMLGLASNSGCLACHRVDPSTDSRLMPLAPSLREIGARYGDDPKAADRLLRSVREGTRAQEKKWHNSNMQFMPPNVALAPDKARELVDWILTLR